MPVSTRSQSRRQRTAPWLHSLLLPWILAETRTLVWLQSHRNKVFTQACRSLGFLGTHEAYMAFLPMLFWFDQSAMQAIGRDVVLLLAAGVYFSGVVKDYVCLPRPPSPPVIRLSKAHTIAQEYGFPSTHTTNAVSLVTYLTLLLQTWDPPLDRDWVQGWTSVLGVYALCMAFSRVYLGMHSFTDVLGGVALGALITWGYWYGILPHMDAWMYSPSLPWVVVAGTLTAIYTFPEPLDGCPCFDDVVCFVSVGMGVLLGLWTGHVDHTDTLPSLPNCLLRFLIGASVVFVWRIAAKWTCMRILLPPVYHLLGLPHASNRHGSGSKLPKTDMLTTTRIIVYTGIAWLAVYGIPLSFSLTAL